MKRIVILCLVVAALLTMGFYAPQPAEEPDCNDCVSVSSGSRELGYPPCVEHFGTGSYRTCDNACCRCYVTGASRLSRADVAALRVWRQQVWEKTPILSDLSSSYDVWGPTVASIIRSYPPLQWLAHWTLTAIAGAYQ